LGEEEREIARGCGQRRLHLRHHRVGLITRADIASGMLFGCSDTSRFARSSALSSRVDPSHNLSPQRRGSNRIMIDYGALPHGRCKADALTYGDSRAYRATSRHVRTCT
jgi:hypothetical protein